MSEGIKIIECPRDAMQGWPHTIATEAKINYINRLLRVGFDTVDFGSFVSPKAVPQMADTKAVLEKLYPDESKLLAIVANVRGAEEAVKFKKIRYLGFPFSISPTFQLRNTNSTMDESFETVKRIQQLCKEYQKEAVVYLSMGFGNPYDDPYDESILIKWAGKMIEAGIGIISLSDTVGIATAGQISFAFETLIGNYPDMEFGAHLHSSAKNRLEKLDAAFDAGCRRFDGAILGIGGCPMAQDELIGNMDTLFMIDHFSRKGITLNINPDELQLAVAMAGQVFSS